jgi:hypothetical protein
MPIIIPGSSTTTPPVYGGQNDGYEDYTSILVPVTLDDSRITSITENGVPLAEDDEPAWVAGTTYAEGDRVHVVSTHRVYESLKAGNTGKDPTKPASRFNVSGTPTWWAEVGPTNRRAAFDGLISTPTAGASPLVFTLRPGPFNGFALFGLEGDSTEITARTAPGGPIIYMTGDTPLEGSAPADWYEYFFDPFKPMTQFVATGIQPYGASELTITIRKGSGDAKVGMIAVGDMKAIGVPERNSRVSPKTYAYIAEDGYGNTTIRRRPSATNLSLALKVPLENADDVIQTVQNLLDVPVVVVGSVAQYHTKMSTFGLVSGEMDYSTYPDRTLNLSVRGFI